MKGSGGAVCENNKDKFKGARTGTPRHADEHNQSGVDVPKSRPMKGSGGAGSESDGDEKEDAGTGTPFHADEHSQSGVDVPESRPMEGGGGAKFTKAIRELPAFSMIEAREDVSAYSVHPVVHEWALQVLGWERKGELAWLAVIVVGKAVPDSTQREYWVVQQRLMPHADCCYRWIGSNVAETYYLEENEAELNEIGKEFLDAVHILGHLYADQGKLAEAEEMYRRALEGREKALGAEHILTLDTVNSLGNLYRIQDKLAEAGKMYVRALEGREKALGAEHISTLGTVSVSYTFFCKIYWSLP
jgi:hypothetical protein